MKHEIPIREAYDDEGAVAFRGHCENEVISKVITIARYAKKHGTAKVFRLYTGRGNILYVASSVKQLANTLIKWWGAVGDEAMEQAQRIWDLGDFAEVELASGVWQRLD